MRELRENQDDRIAWAKDAGFTQMLVTEPGRTQESHHGDVERAADKYNRISERSPAAGVVQGLHNKGFELSTVGGQRTYTTFCFSPSILVI